MCLIGLAWRAHPHWPLIVIANRDEVHGRPTTVADWWPDAPDVVAGRDTNTGGAWHAWHRDGRVALIVNLASPNPEAAHYRSRGALVRGWVTTRVAAEPFLEEIAGNAWRFRGFCLLLSDGAQWHGLTSAAGTPPRRWMLRPGIAAFSSGEPGRRWPKVAYLERELTALLKADAATSDRLFALLARREVAVESATDTQGLRVSRQPFVVGPHYGTRSTTVIRVRADGDAEFAERRFDAAGCFVDERRIRFSVAPTLAT